MEATPTLASTVVRRKRLGAFYTPPEIASKMTEWAVRREDDRALDPSFGGLVFLEAAHQRLVALGAPPGRAARQLFGCDLDEDAHAAAQAEESLGLPAEALAHRDFFELQPGVDLPRVEAVVGNPPYIRYQVHNGAGGAAREIALAAGLRLTRLASSWASFVLHATAFVVPGGRLALVLPAELLHAQYATDVLAWLQRRFARIALAVFEERVFPGALEEVVLLFAEGRDEADCPEVSLLECQTLNDLDAAKVASQIASAQQRPRRQYRGQSKLLAQLLPAETHELYERLASEACPQTQRLGDLASVDIGAVTGANNFFLLRAGEYPELDESLLRPAISKAVHVRGARFTSADYVALLEAGARCRLWVGDNRHRPEALETAAAFLDGGVASGIPARYKCRVRTPWWAVPLPKHGVPDLFLTYCSSEHPRLVVNEDGVLHTNTVHGVKVRVAIDPKSVAVAFFNSLTLLSAELVGRSYGGGVLKLEPTEAEALVLPEIHGSLADELHTVDQALRAGDLPRVLEVVDRLLLIERLGLSKRQVELLRAGANRLRTRRRTRNKAPRGSAQRG